MVSVFGKTWFLAVLLLLLLLALTGCAAGPNTQEDIPAPNEGVAGFWRGLWQGIIAPITFVISLFSDSVNVYEVHNNGNWYNFGFILGAGVLLGGGGGATGRRKR
jgi:hypothetical protein